MSETADKHLGLVKSLAAKYARYEVLTFDELVSEGCFALVRYVCPRYRPELGAFSTYATPAVAKYMMRAIRAKINDPHRSQASGNGRGQPHAADLDNLPADADEAPPARAVGDVEALLRFLSPAERAVVRWRHGLTDGKAWEWADIAARTGQAEDVVRAVYDGAVLKMRRHASDQQRRAA